MVFCNISYIYIYIYIYMSKFYVSWKTDSRYFEALVYIFHTSLRHIPEDHNLDTNRLDNLVIQTLS